MASNFFRYGVAFVLIHWLVAFGVFALLGLGAVLVSDPTTTLERARILDLHISLGLVVGVLVVVQIIARLLFGAPAYAADFPRWRGLASRIVSGAANALFLFCAASGVAQATFSGAPMRFFGVDLPALAEANADYAALAAQIHLASAYGLAGAVLAHLAFILWNAVACRGFAGRMSLFGPRGVPAADSASLAPGVGGTDRVARELAGRFRLLGWIAFILQFILAVLSALLLQFAAAGHAMSAAKLGFGDAIFWGGGSLAALCLTCALAFYTTRVGAKLARAPDKFLGEGVGGGFLFLGLGAGTSVFGIGVAMIGLALSIVLLIAKTVSQPPGIAIIEPDKIIRALDVFVLLVNFNLLIAHFFGVAISGGLYFLALKARATYRAYAAMRAS